MPGFRLSTTFLLLQTRQIKLPSDAPDANKQYTFKVSQIPRAEQLAQSWLGSEAAMQQARLEPQQRVARGNIHGWLPSVMRDLKGRRWVEKGTRIPTTTCHQPRLLPSRSAWGTQCAWPSFLPAERTMDLIQSQLRSGGEFL